MKISELVKKTHVSKETIHYYVREGLVSKPKKPGKNVAIYDERCIDQIKTIKRLQDNYFLPLSVIKKIIKKHRTKPDAEQLSFEVLSEFIKPVDYFLSSKIADRDAFREETGLSRKWLAKMEEWDVITPSGGNGNPVYSQDDVIIGRLIVEMDRTGYGPKDGTDPEDLRRIADFIRDYIINAQQSFFQAKGHELAPEELQEKQVKIREIMSLFFYHVYRKIVWESAEPEGG
jgi:DNA-binding transcriptional MerR regulator